MRSIRNNIKIIERARMGLDKEEIVYKEKERIKVKNS